MGDHSEAFSPPEASKFLWVTDTGGKTLRKSTRYFSLSHQINSDWTQPIAKVTKTNFYKVSKGFNIALCNFQAYISIQSFSEKMEVIKMIVIIHNIP